MTWLGVLALALMGGLLELVIWRARRWCADNRKIAGRVQTEHLSDSEAGKVDFRELDQLPPPVAAYFRRVLREGQPLIRAAKLHQTGGFRVSPRAANWSRFQAEQYFSVRPAGFLWDASIALMPGMKVRVRDTYLEGRGGMRVALWSAWTLVNPKPCPELNAAALQRYLAEAAWFPTALFPGQGVTWTPINARRALATLRDGENTVSLEFGFNEANELVEAYSPGRYREINGEYQTTPWQGFFSDYYEEKGMRIPRRGEVAWLLPEGRFAYWRGEIDQVAFA